MGRDDSARRPGVFPISPPRIGLSSHAPGPGRRVPLPMAARRRKVRLSPFPPNGENCARSLSPPLPGEPAALGFAGSNEGSSKTPPGFAPRSTVPVLQVAAPRTPLRGTRSWLVRAEVPARKIRSAWVRFFPGPLGPWVGKICFRCGSRAAPGFAEPTLPVRILAAKYEPRRKRKNAPSQKWLRANQTIRGST